MKRRRRRSAFVLRRSALVLALGLVALPPGAAEGPSLPAFPLVDLDGQAVPSSALVRTGRSLLLYVSPSAGPGRALLEALRAEDPLSRVTVIVAGSKEEARALAGAVPGTAGARFLADPGRRGFAALSLRGLPAAIGLRDGSVAWTWLGAGEDPSLVRSRLVGWIR